MPAGPAETPPPDRSFPAALRGRFGLLALLFAGVLLPLWLFAELADEVQRLKREIRLTLEENRHLADGDVCTLSRLKSAIAT